jgi:hypothetical protein
MLKEDPLFSLRSYETKNKDVVVGLSWRRGRLEVQLDLKRDVLMRFGV